MRKGDGMLSLQVQSLLMMPEANRKERLRVLHWEEFTMVKCAPLDRVVWAESDKSHALTCADRLPVEFWWIQGSWLLGQSFFNSRPLGEHMADWLVFWLENIVELRGLAGYPRFSDWLFEYASAVGSLGSRTRLVDFAVLLVKRCGFRGANDWEEYLKFKPVTCRNLRDLAFRLGLLDQKLWSSVPYNLLHMGPKNGDNWFAGFWLIGHLMSYSRQIWPQVGESLCEEALGGSLDLPGNAQALRAWAVHVARNPIDLRCLEPCHFLISLTDRE